MVKVFAGGAAGGVSKTIGTLNKSGALQQPIQFNEVIGPLSAVGDQMATQLLEELASQGSQIRDPTAWLTKAAMRKSGMGGGGKGSWGKGGGKGWSGGDAGGVSKIIGALNKSGSLQIPIQFNEVIGPLSAIGDHMATQLLQELASQGPQIRDPTAWLTKAAMRGGGGKGSSAKGQMVWVPAGAGGYSDGKKVSKMVGWMNKNVVALAEQPIQFSEVQGPLMMIDETEACKLLKELEEKASEIKNPTKWLTAAAMRRGGGGQGMYSVGGGYSDGKKVSKMIGWMNKNVAALVEQPIQFSEVQGPLMMISETEACKLLKELEEKASEIKSPTNWLKAAASRRM